MNRLTKSEAIFKVASYTLVIIFEIVTVGIVFALGYFAAKNNWFDIIIETDIFQSIIEFFRETFNIIK